MDTVGHTLMRKALCYTLCLYPASSPVTRYSGPRLMEQQKQSEKVSVVSHKQVAHADRCTWIPP